MNTCKKSIFHMFAFMLAFLLFIRNRKSTEFNNSRYNFARK